MPNVLAPYTNLFLSPPEPHLLAASRLLPAVNRLKIVLKIEMVLCRHGRDILRYWGCAHFRRQLLVRALGVFYQRGNAFPEDWGNGVQSLLIRGTGEQETVPMNRDCAKKGHA